MTGSNTIDTHLKSYRSPIKKEGAVSANETAAGRKAKNVINLYNVNMKRKIRNRLMTQRIVFGILKRVNIIDCKILLLLSIAK
jgi:hypothetical protein